MIPANPASFPVKFHREHCPDDDKDNLKSSGTHSYLSSAFPSLVSAAKMNEEKMEYGNVTYIYCKSETSNEGQKQLGQLVPSGRTLWLISANSRGRREAPCTLCPLIMGGEVHEQWPPTV